MRRYYLFLLLGLAIILIAGSGNSKKVQMDATDADMYGENEMLISIGEIKQNYRIEVEVTNHGTVTNISAKLAPDQLFGYGSVVNATGLILPGETDHINYQKQMPTPADYVIVLVTYLNSSAYMDLQENVEIECKVKVYNDRGEVIVDSEDPELDDPVVLTDEEGCGGAMVLSTIALTFLLGSMIFILSKKRDSS
jgi:hypothetical protein